MRGLKKHGHCAQRVGAVLLLSIAYLVIPVATLSPAYAEDGVGHAEKKRQEAYSALEFASATARDAMAAYTSAQAQLPAAQKAVSEAKGKVAAKQVVAREAQRHARKAEKTRAAAQRSYQGTRSDLGKERDTFARFVRNSYATGSHVGIAAILTVNGPDQLLAAVQYVDILANQRHQAVSSLRTVLSREASQRAAATAAQRRADKARTEAQAALRQAQAAEAAAVAAQQSVQHLIKTAQTSYAVAESERVASQQRYDAARAESERIRAQLQNQASVVHRPSGESGGAVSQLRKPVRGFISSHYGQRYDPYFHQWQLHAGTDFAAPGGAPIRAAASGRVVRAGWNGGYGNYTCIHHGSNSSGQRLATCYAHQSSLGVYSGQYVHQGDVIGRVGTTGASTGNHLHFEVRLDGTPMNPLGFL